uniref:Aldehyde dehydrogenase domain-containing protein n=1 Tax=Denticeps clupeoides TaxID=299321 RepID=A0AAY4BXZ3_9TELE
SAEVLRRARDAFKAGRTAEHGFRLAQLDALVRLVVEHECDFVDALGRDLHKVILFHLSLVPVVFNINLTTFSFLSNKTTALDESVVVSEPLGVVLIIGSWSSPVQQCLVPLVGAIAAGNCVVIKPSEICSHTAELLHRHFASYLDNFYGSDPRESRSFGRIVTTENFNRVRDLLWRSGKVVMGGQVNEAERYIAPTIVVDVVDTDPIMQQEVSGPVLPIVTVQSVDEAIGFINKRDKPLCVYVYSSNSKIPLLLDQLSLNGRTNSEYLLLFLLTGGNVGSSGIGCYHGRYSFDTFSHKKACLLRGLRVECMTYLRYPPYEDRNLSLVTWASTLKMLLFLLCNDEKLCDFQCNEEKCCILNVLKKCALNKLEHY